MPAYYNEIDHAAAEWLRTLIAGGLIPAGTVDERSIADVRGSDLAGFDQCHFFAGIGGWPYALQLTDWRGPVWTGSCPCQPLSVAGQRKGHADKRHLWPAFHRLIAECKPATVFGEQVESKDGREWLAGIRADLEATGYAVGAADLCAPSVGAPIRRQRLYWVASADHAIGRSLDLTRENGCDGSDDRRAEAYSIAGARGQVRALDRTDGARRFTEGQGPEVEARDETRLRRFESGRGNGYWDAYDVLPCLDGKARRVEPGTFPLAHGVPARLGRLRGYGNAIVPQVAAEFVTAFMECRP